MQQGKYLKIYLFMISVIALIFLVKNEYSLIVNIFFEFVFIAACISMLPSRIHFVAIFIYSLLLAIQLVSFKLTGAFIIPLTLTNIGESEAIGFEKKVSIGLYFIFSCLIIFHLVLAIKNRTLKLSWWWRNIGIFIVMVFFAFYQSPTWAFVNTINRVLTELSHMPKRELPPESKKYYKYGFWENKPPIKYQTKLKNVIVIFTEGMSAGVLDRNNDKNLGLTPNINKLVGDSLYIDNYFNHTAATYRGLRGQLTSFYQYRDGHLPDQKSGFDQDTTGSDVVNIYKDRLISLPRLLKNNNYKTYFISSTSTHSNLSEMLRTLHFDKVYGMGDFYPEDKRMSDSQTFDSLISVLSGQKKELLKNDFFIGVYPSGTHYGVDSPDLMYQNGENSNYNKFHNYDHQLSKFINYFKNSEYFKNTLLVITSDHSAYPSPDFKESFGIETNQFVDRIPFILYGSDIPPGVYDAKMKNSLSFAPTILNILDLNDGFNYFLGCSVFEKECDSRFSYLSIINYGVVDTSGLDVAEIKGNKYLEKELSLIYDIGG